MPLISFKLSSKNVTMHLRKEGYFIDKQGTFDAPLHISVY